MSGITADGDRSTASYPPGAPDRPQVEVGDLLDLPAGVDRLCTTHWRLRVKEVKSWAVWGIKERLDGRPARNRLGDPIERGLFPETIAKATIIRGDPGGEPS